MTTPEEQLEALRHLLLQAEAQHGQTITLVRKALGEIEDQVRELRREAAMRNVEFFTEEKLAARVGVSASTIKRMRLKKQIVPCEIGGPLRYSTAHVEQLSRIPLTPASDPRKRHGHLREVTQDRRQKHG
jgi:hypothetical protein